MSGGERAVAANGITFAVRLEGPAEAPVVMFSNGLGTTHRSWDAQVDALTDRYRVLRYDQRGHGRSGVSPPPYGFDLLAADVVALLAALGIGKVHFCGLSMGGMTGMVLGARYPEMLHGLVLSSTSCEKRPAGVYDRRIEEVRRDGMAPMVAPTMVRWFTAPFRAANPETVARVGRMIAETPVEGYVGGCTALAAMDLADAVRGITLPTLVIAGAEDPSTTVAHAEAIQERIAGARLEIVDDASHMAPIERAAAFNGILRRHLDAL